MKKKVISYDRRAFKEYKKLTTRVQLEFDDIFLELEEKGFLREPEGKRLSSFGLFEMRVNVGTIWRCLYADLTKEEFILLRFFQKKSPKTPRKEIKTALQRLSYYKKNHGN